MKALLDEHNLLPPLYSAIRTRRGGMVMELRALVPILEKEAYVGYGFSSLYLFLVRHCKMTNAAAFRRKHCVPLVMRHPKLLEALADGTITLSNLTFARNIVNHDDIDATIAMLSGKSEREVQNLVAARDPKWRPKTGITKISDTNPGGNRKKDKPIVPLDDDLFKSNAVFDGKLKARLDHIQEMMLLENPDRDPDYLFEALVTALEEKLEKKLFSVTDRPHAAKPSKDPAYISNEVRREVYKRDGGQCTSVDGSGERCPLRSRLEFDHIDPRSNGGSGAADNVRLLCRKHHREHTKKTFGEAFIAEKIEQRKKAKLAKASVRNAPPALAATRKGK